MTGQLLTAAQLARRYQLPVSQIYRLTRTGVLPAVRLGRYYRYAPAALEAFEASFTNSTKEAAA
jgi:excisionase family DNA binding protein